MTKNLAIRFLAGALVLLATFVPWVSAQENQENWALGQTFSVTASKIPVFTEPGFQKPSSSYLYSGMTIEPKEWVTKDGVEWFKVADRSLWIPATESNGIPNVAAEAGNEEYSGNEIIDLYGILDQPHRYAAKLVKFPDAKARLETYEKTDSGYLLRQTYDVTYRKEGPKDKYGDLKSPGGPVIRYLYRTTRTGMGGRDKTGKAFGAYKVSYPMPHDALPYLLKGKMTLAQYANIPAINRIGDKLYPHPQSMLGADIVLHTARRGSRGCLNIENEAMSFLYHEDLVTENDQEIIPFVIYDEDRVAPPIGELL